MRIYSRPNVEFAIRRAHELLIEEGIDFLPVDPFEIASNRGWGPISYYKIVTDPRDPYKDGLIQLVGNKFKIFYNELAWPSERIRWTIAHEIGHIYLGHADLYSIDLLNQNKNKYWSFEREANIFAAELLAPLELLKIIEATSKDDIQVICEISKEAASIREREIIENGNDPIYISSRGFLERQFSRYIKPLKEMKKIFDAIDLEAVNLNA